MNSSCYKYSFSICYLSFWRIKVSDYQHIYWISRSWFSGFSFPYKIKLLLNDLFFQKKFQIRISIWKPVRKINLITIIHNLKVKTQRVIRIWFRSWWIIINIISSSIPALLSLLISSFWVKQYFHALIILRIILTKVRDVEFIRVSNSSICNFEVKPLGVALWIIIRSDMKIILKFTNLYCSF